jgi:triphosphatase
VAEEIELKLRVQAADLPRLRALLTRLAGGARPRRARLSSLYFDTPELDLLRAGAALRVRRVGRRWVQTLKGGGAVHGGLHRRQEQEGPVPGPLPDPSRLDAPPGLSWTELAPGLVQVFGTEFQRSTWQIARGGSTIEAALDQGRVRAADEQEALLELELELKSGTPDALYALALELAAAISLAPDPVSKAERGYRLFRKLALAPAKAAALALEGTQSVEQAFIAIVWSCLDQLQRNQRGVVECSDPEFIHQARVALRRLRSALVLFAGVVPRESWAAWAPELRWLADELGAARDWDVLEEELLPPLAAHMHGRKPLGYLPRRVHAERLKARRRARAATLSPRYGALVLGIECWLAARAWRPGATAEQQAQLDAAVRPLADALLERRHRQVRRRGRHLARLSDAQRHRLRVTAKKLRYAVDFFATLYPRKAARPYLAALVALQDVLGALNDDATALRHAAQLCAGARDPRCGEEAGILTGWCAARMAQQLQSLSKAWKDFQRRRPFWDRA